MHELSCESRIGLRWTSCVKPFYILVVIHVLNHESRYFNAVLLRGSGNVLWKRRLSFQQHGGRRWWLNTHFRVNFSFNCFRFAGLSVQKHVDWQRHTVLCEMRHLLEVFRSSFLNNTNYVSHTNPQFGNFFSLGNFPTPILQIINEDGTFK